MNKILSLAVALILVAFTCMNVAYATEDCSHQNTETLYSDCSTTYVKTQNVCYKEEYGLIIQCKDCESILVVGEEKEKYEHNFKYGVCEECKMINRRVLISLAVLCFSILCDIFLKTYATGFVLYSWLITERAISLLKS